MPLMPVEGSSPHCFSIVLKGFFELYFQARMSFPFRNLRKSWHRLKWLFEVWKWKEITLFLILPQGTGPGTLWMLMLGEGVTAAVLSVPCSSQAHRSVSWAFLVAIPNISQISQALRMHPKYLHLLYSRWRTSPCTVMKLEQQTSLLLLSSSSQCPSALKNVP